jgi:hypothetical protein
MFFDMLLGYARVTIDEQTTRLQLTHWRRLAASGRSPNTRRSEPPRAPCSPTY